MIIIEFIRTKITISTTTTTTTTTTTVTTTTTDSQITYRWLYWSLLYDHRSLYTLLWDRVVGPQSYNPQE